MLNSFIEEIAQSTNCSINVHGLNTNSELVWIKIKNNSEEARKTAYNLINAITNNSCKEVKKRTAFDFLTFFL
jgi:hypothetical protein